jgi:hypothetical protein
MLLHACSNGHILYIICETRLPQNLVMFMAAYFKAELHTVIICNLIYCHLSYTTNYNTFSLAVYLTFQHLPLNMTLSMFKHVK